MPRMKKVEDMSMKSIKIPMTDAQMRKLAKGQGIRVNPSSNCTAYDVWCKAGKCKRMEKMMMKGKGFALKFDPEEMDENIEIEGGRINFKKIGRTLRSTAKATAKAVGSTAKAVGKFYREKIRPKVGPEIRKAVSTAIEKGIPLAVDALAAYTGQPEIAAATAPVVEKLAKKAAEVGTEKISKLTGAFGMAKPLKMPAVKKGMTKKVFLESTGGAMKMDKSLAKQIYQMEHPKTLPYRAQLQDNYSPFLNPNHPGMNPTLPMPDNSLPLVGKGMFMGGSGVFLSARERGGMMGSPMDPGLPPIDNSTYYM